jgi:hypothetical protein
MSSRSWRRSQTREKAKIMMGAGIRHQAQYGASIEGIEQKILSFKPGTRILALHPLTTAKDCRTRNHV